jgi:LacI family transcriptional regulator
VNIYDISQMAGVSIATVSRVINGSSHVSDATRQKVLAVIDEVGYTPSIHARSLGSGTMKTVGVLCADASDIFLANALNHIEGLLRAEGYHSLLCCTGHELENKRRALRLLLAKRVDALILIGSQFHEAGDNGHIIKAARQVPVIMINGALTAPGLVCVRLDHEEAIYQGALALANQGRRMLYLYDSLTFSGREKLAGYERAMKAAKQEVDALRCIRDVDAACSLLQKSLPACPSPLGVVCSEDILAVGAVKAARELGLSVPDELSVIGFNNSILCRCCQPELSSMDSQVQLLCTQAINRLMALLEGKPAPEDTILQGVYVPRETTVQA